MPSDKRWGDPQRYWKQQTLTPHLRIHHMQVRLDDNGADEFAYFGFPVIIDPSSF
jgi:hypothetical protein